MRASYRGGGARRVPIRITHPETTSTAAYLLELRTTRAAAVAQYLVRSPSFLINFDPTLGATAACVSGIKNILGLENKTTLEGLCFS